MAINQKGLFANQKQSKSLINPFNLKDAIKIGRVKDIILTKDYPNIEDYGGDTAIGTIFFEEQNLISSKSLPAKPFFPQFSSYPLVNELVLLFQLPNQNIGINRSEKSYYYMNMISLWNHPHHNAYPNPKSLNQNKESYNESYSDSEKGIQRKASSELEILNLNSPINVFQNTFIERSNIHPLLPFAGDIIHQGRWGNSIRLGSTAKSTRGSIVRNAPSVYNNDWSDVGKNGDPITILRNGQPRNASEKGWEHITERIQDDLSSIYLTSYQSIKLTPASENYRSYINAPTSIKDYTNPQILLNSSRVVINANMDSTLIGAKDSINLNSNNSVNINTQNLRIDAGSIKLGSKDAEQDIVLGNKLYSLLDNLLIALLKMTKVMKTSQIWPNGVPQADLESNTEYASVHKTLDLIQKDLESILSKNVKTI